MKQVLLLEDHPDARQWLRESVWQAFPEAVIETCETLAQALDALDRVRPDLCLVDLRLPDGSGIDFIHRCRGICPTSYQVVATMFDDDQHLFPAIQAGANGYLLKEEPRDVIARALAGIASGLPPLSPQVARRMLAYFQQRPAHTVEPEVDTSALDLLSPREQEILVVIARGYKTAEAANMLGVTYHTAASHVKSIYGKLGIGCRAEAVQEAHRLGLVRD